MAHLIDKDFEMALAEMIDKAQTSVVEPLVIAAQWKDELIKLAKSEEPVSEELETEIEKYLNALYRNWTKKDREKDADVEEMCRQTACHFAQWQKEQLMSKAIDATVHIDAGGYPYVDRVVELYDYDKDIPLAKEGDKYKVILIKED